MYIRINCLCMYVCACVCLFCMCSYKFDYACIHMCRDKYVNVFMYVRVYMCYSSNVLYCDCVVSFFVFSFFFLGLGLLLFFLFFIVLGVRVIIILPPS